MPSPDHPSSSVNSYASVHDTLSAKHKSYAEKFKQHVLDYLVEWEKAVRTRIDNGLKKADDMRRDLDHYQKKVESLRISASQAIGKGKQVKPEAQEKLKRNEEKLLAAKQNFNQVTSALCILMEEVTERSWRDLHPALVKAAQFDMTLASDEAKILSNLQQVVSALKDVANKNGISAQHRLKDLASLKPELLSTRPGGVSGLQLEGPPSGNDAFFGSGLATSPSGYSGVDFSSMAQPPGTVAPQGMGGFPVQISSDPPQNQYSMYNRSGSLDSIGSYNSPSTEAPLSTMNMLTISQNSAPPPTFEDIYSYTKSAPSSGNLPPLVPNSNSRSMRSSSLDNLSNYSGAGSTISAPPAAPPPPPPAEVSYGGGYGAPTPSYGTAPSPFSPPPPSMYGSSGLYGQNRGSDPPQYGMSSPWGGRQDPPHQVNPTNPFG